jgi:rhamnosyltransferase
VTGLTGIYVLSDQSIGGAVARHGLSHLRKACERLIVVTSKPGKEDLLAEFNPDEIVIEERVETSYMAGVRRGLLATLARDPAPAAPVLVTGAHVVAPIGPLEKVLEQFEQRGAQLYAPYWHNPRADLRLKDKSLPARVPYLDFSLMAPELLTSSGLRAFWERFSGRDQWSDLTSGLVPFARQLEADGHQIMFPSSDEGLGTADPRLFEIDRVIEGGAPAFPLAVLLLDPLIHDINAISLRPALDHLRVHDPAAYHAAMAHASKHVPLREFNAAADQVEIFENTPAHPGKTQWNFGTIAVFIHVYYPEMIGELAALVERIPAPVDLYVTTASEENRKVIEDYLLRAGHKADAVDVRVVEQNRGRDMSSLFITFRDVILSDKYEVALRLHSKRTPQVSPSVAEEFRTHLFENLVASRGYVSNLLDRLEAEPDIGLMIPPVIHIGFATLGHSWFNNFEPTRRLAQEMGLDVPLDSATPVAPNGTMYWFRTQALRKMFEWPWAWEDYSKEPHHVDGGLAHVQERLIGYCVRDAGYRVLAVMSPKLAARKYAKLEYKMQRIMSHLPSGNIVELDLLLSRSKSAPRARLYHMMRDTYGKVLVRWPASRRVLRPWARALNRLLAFGPRQ